MPTLYLVLTWAVLGIIIGALALAAHLKPVAWGRTGWVWLLVLALGSALLGGLLGLWLLGRLFSTVSALWFAVIVTCAPWAYSGLRARLLRGPKIN